MWLISVVDLKKIQRRLSFNDLNLNFRQNAFSVCISLHTVEIECASCHPHWFLCVFCYYCQTFVLWSLDGAGYVCNALRQVVFQTIVPLFCFFLQVFLLENVSFGYLFVVCLVYLFVYLCCTKKFI